MDIRHEGKSDVRLRSLDGWRGISILLVLAAHLLPLGPSRFELNESSGILGMAFFFTLSGFLITNALLRNDDVTEFLIRRVFRIIPLAWLCAAIILYATQADKDVYLANFLFYANWPPMWLSNGTGHFWSLCVEMQFYGFVALLVVVFRRHWKYLIPILCVSVTLYRIANGSHAVINTYYRVDEILVGGLLALVFNDRKGAFLLDFLAQPVVQVMLFLLLLLSCHPQSGAVNYFRPYLAAAVVAGSLSNSKSPFFSMLNGRRLFYIASISYALYVIHPLLIHTWLGSGVGIEKYAKRPLFFVVLFALAHISTFYYEKFWLSLSKKLIERRRRFKGSQPLEGVA